jgi:hypothetical protein
MQDHARPCTAFAGHRQIASGTLGSVAEAARALVHGGEQAPVLVFDDATGAVIDLDLRDPSPTAPADSGASTSNLQTTPDPAAPARRGPGRPRLGVVAGEVTLLPRHWEWLKSRPGGASVAIRKLVDEARRASEAGETIRRARDAAYRFMMAMAGDQPGYEEALRALYAGQRDEFAERLRPWPADVRDHALRLATPSFGGAKLQDDGVER